MENKYFEITSEQGEKITCEILDYFKYKDEFYMIYTDGLLDDDGNIEVLASKYKTDNNKITLYPIEKDEEWDIIDKKWAEKNE